jgi:hypothetical protein
MRLRDVREHTLPEGALLEENFMRHPDARGDASTTRAVAGVCLAVRSFATGFLAWEFLQATPSGRAAVAAAR